MTRGPRRLKEDTDFQWETGCDLADEELVAGEFDHDRMRSRLLAAVALLPAGSVGDGVPNVRPSPASGAAWPVALRPVVAALTGAVVVAGAYWLGVRAGADLPVVPIDAVPEQHAPAEAPLAPPATQAAPGEVEGAGPSATSSAAASPGRATRVRLPQSPLRTSPVAGGAPDAGAPSTAAAAPEAAQAVVAPGPGTADAEPAQAAAPAPAAATSLMLEDTLAFERARDALTDGRYAQARQAFDAYLTRFPRGAMRPEAELGRLEAARGTGDAAAVEALAASIEKDPALSARRGEILRLRAEALVELGRCDEAILVSEQSSSRAAADIRRACRARRD